jgi:hypothetical protein
LEFLSSISNSHRPEVSLSPLSPLPSVHESFTIPEIRSFSASIDFSASASPTSAVRQGGAGSSLTLILTLTGIAIAIIVISLAVWLMFIRSHEETCVSSSLEAESEMPTTVPSLSLESLQFPEALTMYMDTLTDVFALDQQEMMGL